MRDRSGRCAPGARGVRGKLGLVIPAEQVIAKDKKAQEDREDRNYCDYDEEGEEECEEEGEEEEGGGRGGRRGGGIVITPSVAVSC